MLKLTLTEQLTELIAAKPVAPTDLEQASLLTLDALANALAGRVTEPGQILQRWAGATAATDAERSAFLLGALTHILETDDLHRASVVHPGCVVVPAAWTVALREGIRGHAMLKAVLWGFEATTRVGHGGWPVPLSNLA
jgi:2-methylcitrate dehydratase PrpD